MRVLAISAHPDDETLGCGGTLLKHKAVGDELFWLIATQPFEPAWRLETIQRKADEVTAVAHAYQFDEVYRLGLQTTRLDMLPQADIMSSIRDVVGQVRPNWIYLVNPSDVHSDHRIVFTATMAVLKPFAKELSVNRILCYECLSSTEAAPALTERAFLPNVFSDITSRLEQKIRIMGLYETEAQPDPLPRGPSAIRALARYRGTTIGVEYAEAFALIRDILDP